MAVRTWFALSPIAEATGDRGLLGRAGAWFAARVGTFPSSPYGLINHAAVDIRLHAASLGPRPVLEPQVLLPGFDIPDGAASWLASIERIVDAWLDRGDLDAASDGAARYLVAAAEPTSTLLRSSRHLVRARIDLAAGRLDHALAEARDAYALARQAGAPWWVGRSIRLLESLDAATADEIAEAARMEAALGIAGR